jgi:pimeloyl-ACP methyl ester carboxylesterase
MFEQIDIDLGDERTLRVYDAGGPADAFPVFWHHGTPNLGLPPEPLFPAAAELGLRWVSYDRPGYGGSTARPGRDVASAAGDVERAADALGIERFAVMGHSGGGPHALAGAALLPDRVVAAICGAGLAPYRAAGLDWFGGMAASGVASLRAAAAGRAAKDAHEQTAEYDPEFTDADWAALNGDWGWLGQVATAASKAGPAALIDDDLAYVHPWGFDPSQIAAPVLFVHGGRDRVVPSSHSDWLAQACGNSELRFYPEDGHVSVLTHAAEALAWLRTRI